MEFILSTDLQKELPQMIQFNHDEIKQELSKQLEKYNAMVITEKDIKLAKSDKASLNKLKAALDSHRKEIKKQYLAPYEEFAAKVNELIALIDEPVQSIDKQLKEYENIKKDEKKAEIEQLYCELIGDLKELVPIERLWKDRWLNATYKISDIEAEIGTIGDLVEDGLEIINGLDTEFKKQITDRFFSTLDITKALAENNRLKELKQKQEVYEKMKVLTPTVSTSVQEAKPTPQQECNPEEKATIDFRVSVTQEQMHALKQFLEENNIQYGRVPSCQVTA